MKLSLYRRRLMSNYYLDKTGTKKCTKCGMDVPMIAKKCPYCGSTRAMKKATKQAKKDAKKEAKLAQQIPYANVANQQQHRPMNKVGKVILVIVGVLFLIMVIIACSVEDSDTNGNKTKEDGSELTSVEELVTEAVEYGSLESINTSKDDDGETDIVEATINCSNHEDVVRDNLRAIWKSVKEEENTEFIIRFEDDGTLTAVGRIKDGHYKFTSKTSALYTEHDEWVSSLFSAWDGECNTLSDLIKDNLKDPKSYDHLETGYKEITKSNLKECRKSIKSLGYTGKVSKGDVWIQVDYTADNSFGGTVRGVAYGLADYSENKIVLFYME